VRLVLLGPPGVGKGTQAQAISARFQLPKIATGDMLRESIRTGDELGQKAAAHVEAGRLVPDALMISLVRQRLQREDCRAGFLLDGFPRTLPQAEALEEVLEDLDMMLERGNAEGEALIMGAVDALVDQTRSIERAVAVLGVDQIEFEGSDSLDNPDAVFQ